MARLSKERRLDRNWTPPADDADFGHRQPAVPDAERALLGSALINPRVMAEVGDLIMPDDFYITKHGDVWAAMLELTRKREPVDVLTVLDQLGEHPSVDSVLLADLINGTPSASHASSYAKRIKNASRRRQIIQAAGEIGIVGYEETDAAEAEEKAKQILLRSVGTEENSSRILTPEQQARLLVDMFEARAQGLAPALATGYSSFDAATNGGLRGGELVIVAARTSVGKSSYAENVAENIAKRQNQVIYFNLEMSDKRMLERFAKRQHKLSLSAYETGPIHEKDVAAMYELAEDRAQMPLTLISDHMASTASIWADCSHHVIRNGKLQLVVVDYLQLLTDKDTKTGSEVQRIAKILRSLKGLAGELDVPVMLISQLNRNVEHRGGEPELYDLRDSGSIEQDADIVLLMWNDDDQVKMKVAKNRDGPLVPLPVHFDGASFTFSDIIYD